MSSEVLNIWVVYDHPADYPFGYVARRFEWDQPTGDVIASPQLELLRSSLAMRGLYCLPRHVGDAPEIIETWL